MEGRVSDIRRIEDILEQHRGNTKIAVYEGEMKLSYADLCQESDRIVQPFQKEDFAIKGRTVLFYQPKGIPYIAAYFAVNRMGGGFLPEQALPKLGSVGRPLPGIEVKVVREDGTEVSAGEIGEIITASDCVMPGYYKNPKETLKAIRGGWLYTGDLGAFDAEGYLYIKGRKKNMLISGGINLYPEEIEEVLGSHPDIQEAVVSGEKHEVLGEVPVARLVKEEGADITAAQLISYCREYLEDYKIPVRMEFVEQIEKTSTGKILRREASGWKTFE